MAAAASRFAFGDVLQIILNYVNVSPAVLAEFYVDRDRTLIYKWLRKTALPSKKLIPDIIKFVLEHSSGHISVLIKDEIDRYIENSDLDASQKRILAETTDYKDFLERIFYISLSAEKTNISLQKPRSDERYLKVQLVYKTIVNVGLAVLASAVSEILWMLISPVLQWPHDPVLGNQYPAAGAFIWGVVFVFPVILFAVLSLYPDRSFLKPGIRSKKLLIVLGCTLAGGIGGLIIFSTGLGSLLDRFNIGFVAQTVIFAFVYGMVISFMPALFLLIALRCTNISPGTFMLLEFLPAAVFMLAVMAVTFLSQSSVTATAAGIFETSVLKVLMFISAFVVLRGYPDNIRFKAWRLLL